MRRYSGSFTSHGPDFKDQEEISVENLVTHMVESDTAWNAVVVKRMHQLLRKVKVERRHRKEVSAINTAESIRS